MSQERTEQDQKTIEDVRKTQRDGGPLWEVELAALREIDLLNAVIVALREEGKKKDTALEVVQTRFGRYVDHSRDYESRLLSRIDEEVDAVKVLTAQAQERDERIQMLTDDNSVAWNEVEVLQGENRRVSGKVHKRDKEIERLRAEVDFARIEFNGIGLQAYVAGADKINRRATEAGERMFAALKGAE